MEFVWSCDRLPWKRRPSWIAYFTMLVDAKRSISKSMTAIMLKQIANEHYDQDLVHIPLVCLYFTVKGVNLFFLFEPEKT